MICILSLDQVYQFIRQVLIGVFGILDIWVKKLTGYTKFLSDACVRTFIKKQRVFRLMPAVSKKLTFC